MNTEPRRDKRRHQDEDDDLPVGWKQIQTAIWLVGLAILFWRGWWWPGILILAAISALFQGAVQLYLNRQQEQNVQVLQTDRLAEERANWLPSVCPNCGAPISVAMVRWTGAHTADCPYCNANLRPPGAA